MESDAETGVDDRGGRERRVHDLAGLGVHVLVGVVRGHGRDRPHGAGAVDATPLVRAHPVDGQLLALLQTGGDEHGDAALVLHLVREAEVVGPGHVAHTADANHHRRLVVSLLTDGGVARRLEQQPSGVGDGQGAALFQNEAHKNQILSVVLNRSVPKRGWC